jgi:hypothetical protein
MNLAVRITAQRKGSKHHAQRIAVMAAEVEQLPGQAFRFPTRQALVTSRSFSPIVEPFGA